MLGFSDLGSNSKCHRSSVLSKGISSHRDFWSKLPYCHHVLCVDSSTSSQNEKEAKPAESTTIDRGFERTLRDSRCLHVGYRDWYFYHLLVSSYDLFVRSRQITFEGKWSRAHVGSNSSSVKLRNELFHLYGKDKGLPCSLCWDR